METGWVKLHRKLLKSLIFSSEKGLKIWIWCLCKANHKENTFFLGRQKLTTKEGEFVMGSLKAKEELQMAVATIWYWLDILEKEGLAVIKRTNKYSIVKLKNWNKYQQVENRLNTDEKQIEHKKEQTRMNNNEKNEEEEIVASDEWDFPSKLLLMEKDQRGIQIIRLYWLYKNFHFDNEKKYSAALKRELRPAQQLTGFTDEEIKKTMDYLAEKTELKWTLETIHKYIDDLTSYKK